MKPRIIKLGITFFPLVAGLLFSAPDKASQDKAKCLDTCNKKCAAHLASCKKAAKNDTEAKSCQKSYDLCGSIRVNKACSSSTDSKKQADFAHKEGLGPVHPDRVSATAQIRGHAAKFPNPPSGFVNPYNRSPFEGLLSLQSGRGPQYIQWRLTLLPASLHALIENCQRRFQKDADYLICQPLRSGNAATARPPPRPTALPPLGLAIYYAICQMIGNPGSRRQNVEFFWGIGRIIF